MKKILTLGNICLFIAALVLTIGAALISNACGGDKLTAVFVSAFVGIGGTMTIGGLAEYFNWKITDGPEPGLVATIVGLIIVMLFL